MVLACAAPAAEEMSGEVPEWALRRTLVIGSPVYSDYGFSDVGAVLSDEDRVYVLMRQEGAIRVFTHDGDFVRDIGRRGAGPGEMTSPGLMSWYGQGTIAVGDVVLRCFTLFDVATGEAETIPFREHALDGYGTTRFSPAVALAGPRLLAVPLPSNSASARGVSVKLPMLVSDTAGTVRDTLAWLAMPISVEITSGLAGDARLQVSNPIRESDLWRFAPDGSSVVIVDRKSWTGAGSAEFGVVRVDAEGDTLFQRRIAYEPRAVPDDYYEDEIDLPVDHPVVVDRRELGDALRDFFEQVRYFPPVTRVRVGSEGNTWLAGVEEDGEREWLVLDGAGSVIGRLRFPATSWVGYATPSELWVVERDALDIQYVVRYDIVR